MRVRRLWIENFRGIKKLDWTVPAEQRLIVLVGPGDSGKSTILEAVHFLLGDRWSIPFADTDFHGLDVTEPILIRALLTEVPETLKKESAFGLWLSGVDQDGEPQQEPEDGYEPALLAQLTVDSSLEPSWAVVRLDGGSQRLTATQRRAFSTFKVDDRTDAQLRWSRTSPLGRLSVEDGADRKALAAASRAARAALAETENAALNQLAELVQARANEIGGGRFTDVKPGLDTSRSAMGASLALYEDVIPLTSFGLGSRRLASLAVQQIAAGTRSVAAVDELESGLEPHRAVRLLDYLRSSGDYSQVLVTTHSPVVVEQAKIENLATVRCADGTATIVSLAGSGRTVQRIRRSRPSSLLARRIVLTEGKTEHGLLMQWFEHWDAERTTNGLSTTAGEGVVIQDGEGGSEVALRARALSALGYEVIGFADNDDRSVDPNVLKAEAQGITIVRWEEGHATEGQVCSGLGRTGLTRLLALVVDLRSGEDTVIADLNSAITEGEDAGIQTLDVSAWLETGWDVGNARRLISSAAISRGWFKTVDAGRALGEWIWSHKDKPTLASVVERLDEIFEFVFPAAT